MHAVLLLIAAVAVPAPRGCEALAERAQVQGTLVVRGTRPRRLPQKQATLELRVVGRTSVGWTFRLRLRNLGKRPLWIRAFLLGDFDDPWLIRNVWFDITGPKGILPFRCAGRLDHTLAALSHFVPLKPGASRTEEVALLDCFDTSHPGRYVAKARFMETSEGVPPDADALVDEIVSNEAEFGQ